MSNNQTPYLDSEGLSLDIGDLVKFSNDWRYGTVFKIIGFTISGKAIIRAGLKEYTIDPIRLSYVWVPNNVGNV